MMTGLLHTHSILRYLVLAFIVVAVIDAFLGLAAGTSYRKTSKVFALGSLIVSHIQLLLGFLLYFLGAKGFKWLMNAEDVMKDATARFYTIEHITMMIVAIALVTIGYSRSKKTGDAKRKYRMIAVFYSLALVIIFVMIPWPFLRDFGNWVPW